MNDAAPLTLAFIQHRPFAAARTIADMEPGDAAAFLVTIPARFTAQMLSLMSAWAAAAILALMPAATAAAALRELRYPDATAILRLTAPDTRAEIMTELPKRLTRAFQRSLAFAGNTVGAHMIGEIIGLKPEHTVADAITEIRRVRQAEDELIFVLDDGRRLAGVLKTARLLHFPETTALGDIMEVDVACLPAGSGLAAIATLPDWNRYPSLPVISRRHQVVGALGRSALHREAWDGAMDVQSGTSSLPVAIAETFLATAGGLIELVVSASPTTHGGTRQGDSE